MERWLLELEAGRTQAAWDLLLTRYRQLMLATIRRLVRDDDVMDVFASTCEALIANDCARLRTYSATSPGAAKFPTWLVAVVRNLTIDWLRKTEGRRRIAVPETISPLQREIFRAICIDGASHIEAFEMIRARWSATLSFVDFLRELRAMNQSAPCPNGIPARRPDRSLTMDQVADRTSIVDEVAAVEAARRIEAALATHPDDVRVAVQLFVVERLSAAEVARIVGWPNDKAVYNRVYRALTAVRLVLEREGITRSSDLL